MQKGISTIIKENSKPVKTEFKTGAYYSLLYGVIIGVVCVTLKDMVFQPFWS